ncbi:7693_t:CDS:2 [Entrophospora sp. SA101]|nr:7693_t:CDS:2 [Entrophospora sp. SA101]
MSRVASLDKLHIPISPSKKRAPFHANIELSNAFHIGKKSPVAEILKDAIDNDS